MSADPYQERYLAHQARKREVLLGLLAERHSERRFADGPLDDADLDALLDAARSTASSCDRRGVAVRTISDRDTLALLGGLLVGGVGWVHRAPAVLMMFADPAAYKAGDEITYMPYLDAGVIVGQLYLTAAALGLAGCFINPNVRAAHRPLFQAHFGEGVYCGAYAVGNPRADG
jgi:nitroreductase